MEEVHYSSIFFLIFIFKVQFDIAMNRLTEEITKNEIRSMIDSKVSEYIKEKEFEKSVREITTDAMEKFFRMMYNKRGFWKGVLKNV